MEMKFMICVYQSHISWHTISWWAIEPKWENFTHYLMTRLGFNGSYVNQQKPNFIKDPIIIPPQIQSHQMDNRSEV